MIEEKVGYPFSQPLGNQIDVGRGSKWGEFRVWRHSPGWVIKEAKDAENIFARIGSIVHIGDKNTLKRLKQDKQDYEFFKERLGNSVPESHFVRGNNDKGRPTNFIIQKEVIGRKLADIPDKELGQNPRMRTYIIEFLERCIDIWNKDGRIPDIFGNNGEGITELLNPRYTTNIIIENETDEVKLIDIAAPKQYFSRSAILPIRLRLGLLLKNTQRYIDKLKQNT